MAKKLIKKYQNAPGVLTTTLAEQRHRNIAREYFGQAPTIGNLYNGTINWLKGYGILTPDNTGLITGTAPTPIRARSAKEALEMILKMKLAKRAADAAKLAEKAARAEARARATQERFSYQGKTPELIELMRQLRSAAGKAGALSRQLNPTTSEAYLNRFVKSRIDAAKRAYQEGLSRSNKEASRLTGNNRTPIRTGKHTNLGAQTANDPDLTK